MTKQSRALVAVFFAALISNLVGVLFFFNPIARGDTTVISVHPSIGLLIYVALCIGLFGWATKQTRNAYRAAFIVAASQCVLIIDLTFRGQRGILTAAAGVVLLAVTWSIVAYVYSKINPARSADDA